MKTLLARRGRERHSQRAWVATTVGCVAVLLAGCGGQTPEAASVTVTPTATVTSEAVKSAAPSPAQQITWPLTGVATEEVASRPAVSIKVENSPEARPQVGLEQADIVWDEIVEGGISRFIATYHSQLPEQVGPIRSVRPMDPNILGSLGGLLVFSGGQPQYVSAVDASPLQAISMDRGNGGFSRVSGRYAPHNVMGDMATFLSQADANHSAPPAPQFAFARDAASATAVASGSPATSVSLHMSGSARPSWTWNAGAGVFERSEGSTPAVSAAGNRLTAVNVVSLKVVEQNTSALDPAGNPVPEAIVIGSGEALVASGGSTVAATWTKESASAPFVLTTADGAEVELAPGNTWVELVPSGTGSWQVG